MKLQAMNAVKAYFNRNWTGEDLMNNGEIPEQAYTSLKTVYHTLFCAMLSFTFGSFLHLIWEVGGLFTVLSSVASLLWLYFTSPLRVRQRVSLLMYAACTLGSSFGLFTNYLFEIEPVLIVSLLEASTLGMGIVWFGSTLTRERRDIYIGCLSFSYALVSSNVVVNALNILDSHTANWILKVNIVQALFMGYFVIYSQEILYDAGLGEINSVDRTLTVFLHLPAIVVHVARLCLTDEIEQHRQH